MTEYNRGLAMNVDLKKRSDMFIISFSRHYMLFEMIKKLHRLLKDNGIEYFMVGGVLIGLERHNSGFIPWDDDLDIGVMDNQRELLRSLINSSSEFYIIREDDIKLDKICYKYDKNVGNFNDNVFIDVFYHENADGKYRFIDPKQRKMWPREWFKSNELYPLRKRSLVLYLPDGKKFETTEVIVPNDIKSFLERAYPNYMNKMICSSCHSSIYKDPFSKINMSSIMAYLSLIVVVGLVIYKIYK